MNPQAPTFTLRQTDGRESHIQMLWTEYAYVGEAGPAAPFRTVGLVSYMDGEQPVYTVMHRNQDGNWFFIAPTDLDHKQMETWQAHRRPPASCSRPLALWLDAFVDAATTPQQQPAPGKHRAG